MTYKSLSFFPLFLGVPSHDTVIALKTYLHVSDIHALQALKDSFVSISHWFLTHVKYIYRFLFQKQSWGIKIDRMSQDFRNRPSVPCRFNNELSAYSSLINISNNIRCHVNALLMPIMIEITSTSKTAQSDPQHFSGRIGNLLFLCKKYFDKKPDAPALASFSILGLTLLFYTRYVTADISHVNSTKKGSDFSSVGS